MENCIVVDNIPSVGPDRFEKLRSVLNKLFSKAGDIVHEEYALDENKNTKG